MFYDETHLFIVVLNSSMTKRWPQSHFIIPFHFMKHLQTVTGSNATLGRFFLFINETRFCMIIIFYQYRDIISMGSKKPMNFLPLYVLSFYKNWPKTAWKMENSKKILYLSFWNSNFSKEIFLKIGDLFLDINNTQNWIVIQFLVH